MIIQKAIKVRIYPRKTDKILLDKHFGACRFIYNKFLEIRQKEYLENKKTIGYNYCSALVTEMKRQYEYKWLKEINAQSIQAALKDLDVAYERFFKKISKFPKFKSKRNSRQSYKLHQGVIIDWEDKTIKIPKFKIPFKFKGLYTGKLLKVNSTTISKNSSGQYFAAIQGEFEIEQKKSTGEVIGIDLGINSLLIDSNGNKNDNPKFLKRQLKKLKYYQRQYSKKKIGSKSREKSRNLLVKQHQTVVNQRNNYLNQISSKLINDNQVIILEDLAIKNMMKNHKLAQAISDVSWGSFISMLNYKAMWYNRQIIKIDRFYSSSKICNNCNYIHSIMSLSIRSWICPKCNTPHDRDINAAKNILKQGLIIMSGLGTKSDNKQKQIEASGSKQSL